MKAPKALQRIISAIAFASASLGASAAPFASIAFSPSSIPAGSTSALLIGIGDDASGSFTGGTLTLTYDSNVVNDASGVTYNSCPGTTVTNVTGMNQVVISGISISSFQTCQVYLNVTSSTAGTWTTTLNPGNFTATTPSSSNSNTSSSSLTVVTPTVVTNTNDSGAGSLRDAINTVNGACFNGSAIHFNIPGAGPHVISPLTTLPAVTCAALTIDGYSQPGSAQNTNFIGSGNNASIQVVLNGSACTGGCIGLNLNTDGVHVYGLAIHSFSSSGIVSTAGTTDSNYILGNYIGTDAGGMNSLGNAGWGIEVDSGYAIIGTGGPADNNVVSNNGLGGILVANGSAGISGNQVGGGRDGSFINGNGGIGILFDLANYSSNYVSENRVRNNVAQGIATNGTITRVVIQDNESSGNGGLGIDIGLDGPTLNDEASSPYDTDSVQNYPVITSVVQTGGNTIVSGYLKSAANRTANAIFYANSSASAITEGERGIGNTNITTDATGYGTFSITTAGSNDNVSAQITMDTCGDGCIRSSEYSPKVAATNPLVVTNTNDSGTGSLRDAISYVNANCASQTITFNIPGAGVHTIQPTSGLPALTCAGMAIDGYSQPGAAVNTDPRASNAVILIELNGASIPDSSGFNIAAANIVIAGLSINGFAPGGIGIYATAPLGTAGIIVRGNFIGIAPDGATAKPNTVGIQTDGATLSIGGASASHDERNVISGNNQDVVVNSGNATVIQDNLIGTDATGFNLVAHTSHGVVVSAQNTQIIYNVISGLGASGSGIALSGDTGTLIIGNLIGLTVDGLSRLPNANGIQSYSSSNLVIGIPGTPNSIGGNINDGIYVTGGTGVTIQGNSIGTDPGGTQNLFNGGNGITIDTSTGVAIGGPGAGQGNVIAYNYHGVVVLTGTAPISANSIFANTYLGINLGGGGATTVAPNDNCDVDGGGGNGLANFPVLSTASLNGGMLTVTGTHNSTASTTFRIEYFANAAADNAGNRAGRTYLGFATVTTDGACNATISTSISPGAAVNVGDTITATSTDPSGNTSSFSNAVTVTAPAPAISWTPSSIAFGAQLVGTSSSPVTVTLTNTGTGTLNFSSIGFNAVGAAAYSKTTTCGATLGVGLSCNVNVTFSPASSGAWNANLEIVSDASNSPLLDIPLSGVGALPPTFSIGTGTTSLTPGQATTLVISITNPPGNAVAYGGFTASLTYPAGFVNNTPNGILPQAGCGASTFTGGAAGGNTIGFTAGGDSVAAGVTCNRVAVQVFAPATPGTYTFTIPTGGFTIASPFSYSNPSPITLTVTVAAAPAPGVSLSPPSLTFAPLLMGSTSPSQAVTLTNSGNATLNIASIATTGDFMQANGCGPTLAATASCTINVAFAPTAAGARSGSLVVTDNAVGSPHSISLSGTGIAPTPTVSLTPSSLTFASRTVSTTSPAQTVTLANTGTGTLSISSIAISGDFAFTSACGASVAAGGSCTISVTFTPLVAGTRTGAVTIADNASGSPHTVPLTGTGVSGAAAVATVSPGAVDFSPQQVGSESAQDIVTVSNTGSAPLTFSGIAVTGEFAIVTPTGTGAPACPITLAPGSSCQIALVFRPAGLNLRQGVLTIATNAGTITLNVIGTGMVPEPPQLTVPASLDFGTQPVGTKSNGQALVLKNVSPYVATITELSTSGDFAVSDTCATIAVGATCSPLVTFQPSVIGPATGTLTVRTLRDANPYTVILNGTGIQNLLPVLELSATNIGFGNAFIAMGVTRQVTLKNTGQAPLLIAGILVTGDYFADGACLTTIAPGASCTVHVTFFPTVPGGRSGVLQITSNASNAPTATVNLGGTGCFIPTPARARAGVLLCGG